MPPLLAATAALGLGLAALTTDAHAFPQSTHPAMTDPSKATATAPETFRAKFETTKGDVLFDCTRSWAPNGVDRFYNLVKIGFFDDIALFRVAKGFVVQWGIHGDPKVSAVWSDANIQPDPPKQSNTRGMLTYAMAGSPDTRSTQLFINYGNNAGLDAQGFAPICKVAEGMDVADSFNGEYGERLTEMQGEIQSKGNAYLAASWPRLDYVKTATIVSEGAAHVGTEGEKKKDEDGSSSLPYVIAAFVFLGGIVYFVTRGKDDEKKPEPKAGTPGSKKKKKKRPQR